ncbi:MAG: chromate efflux transporter [Chloroflexota bacterium]
MSSERSSVDRVSFGEALRFWIKLGFVNFGGPAGQIAIMHEELVERRRWIGEARFLHALNYCVLLPGPEAQQLAIYIGWLLHRAKGGLAAGIAFILPAFFLILALSWIYVSNGNVPEIAGLFAGLQAAVVGIVAAAGIRIGSRALRSRLAGAIAAVAFAGIFLAHVPFPLLILGAALAGVVASRVAPEALPVASDAGDAADDMHLREDVQPTLLRSVVVLCVGLAAWILPLLAVSALSGTPPVVSDEAFFFSKAALVTFGGAYAVLAYINQAAVLQYHWLLPGQMVTGLGLAESTPGPLIMVTEFVGFIGAYRHPGTLDPVVAGVVGATVTTWATFAPCFLWIFLGAPYIERLRSNRALTSALAAVTAAVVGIIADVAVTFGIHTLFDRVRIVQILGGPVPVPVPGSVDAFALCLALASFVAVWRFRLSVLWVVAACAVAGVLRVLLG